MATVAAERRSAASSSGSAAPHLDTLSENVPIVANAGYDVQIAPPGERRRRRAGRCRHRIVQIGHAGEDVDDIYNRPRPRSM